MLTHYARRSTPLGMQPMSGRVCVHERETESDRITGQRLKDRGEGGEDVSDLMEFVRSLCLFSPALPRSVSVLLLSFRASLPPLLLVSFSLL